MKQCPNCGDTNGLISYFMEKRIAHIEWNGEYTEADNVSEIYPLNKTGKCIVCGKRFNIEKLRESEE